MLLTRIEVKKTNGRSNIFKSIARRIKIKRIYVLRIKDTEVATKINSKLPKIDDKYSKKNIIIL